MEKPIVFLSHSAKDKKPLAAFKAALDQKTNGTIEFFLSSDGQSLPLGHNWVASLQHALHEAKLAFLFLTANSIGSTWVAFEAGYMHSKGIRVIPVALPGIEFGQVTPPIGLLQGFNMNSHDTMNNVFEILNNQFGHRHAATFTKNDFRKIFGAASELASGFFGEYSALVSHLTVSGDVTPNLFIAIQEALSKADIALSVRDKEGGAEEAAGPGISAWRNPSEFHMEIHRDICSLALPVIADVIGSQTKPPYSIGIHFVNGVRNCGDAVHVSAKAFGTELKVISSGAFSYRAIRLPRGVQSTVWLEADTPIAVSDIKDLTLLLFESGMLELGTPDEDFGLNLYTASMGRRRY